MTTAARTATLALAALAASIAAPASAAFYSNDLESQTVGAAPTGFTVVDPAAPVGAGSAVGTADTHGVVVVDTATSPVSNGAGTGKALRFYDYSGAGVASLQQDFFSDANEVSAARFDLRIRYSGNSTADGQPFLISMGPNGANLGSFANRPFAVSLRPNGRMQMDHANRPGTDATGITEVNSEFASGYPRTSAILLSLFVNGHDTDATSFVGPDGVLRALSPNSVSVYYTRADTDAVVFAFDNKAFRNRAGVYADSTDLARFGFQTGGGQTNYDYVVDDLVVSDIPEPASLALLAAGAAFATGRRRDAAA